MITVDRPLLVGGAPIFRDSDDPDQFWALPATPHLAQTPAGDSSYTLLEYRATDGSGGGFAQVEIELGLPGTSALASVTGRPNARLAPVLFTDGSVSLLTIQGTGDSLVQSVLGSTIAPLVPPFHTVFALDVTEQGAALLAQAATLPTAPIGVQYELRFLAETPALHAHVTMDYDRVYDHFSAALGFTYYVNVRIDAEFSWLVEHGFVTIQITQYTDQADQQRQEQAVLDLVKARIEADFFHTSLPQDPSDNGIPGPLGAVLSNQLGSQINSNSALFTLKARVDIEHELKHFEFDYDGATAESLTHVVSGFLGPMVPDAPAAPVIRQITAQDPFFATLDVIVTPAVTWAGLPDLREVALTLAYEQATKTFLATPDSPGPFRFTCPLLASTPDYTTHVEFHFDPASTAGPATIIAPDTTRHDRSYSVSSADAFTTVRVRLTDIAAAVDLVQQLQVALRVLPAAGGAALADETVVLDSVHPQLDWYRRIPVVGTDMQVMARTDWVGTDGVAHPGTETQVVGGDYLARGPIAELMDVLVDPTVDWSSVAQVLVEIRHDVLGTVQAQSLTFSAGAGTAARTISLALTDPTQRGYQWRATVIKADGTSTAGDWTDADVQVLTVNDLTPPQAGVRVYWLGSTGTALGMQVNFWQTPPGGVEQEVQSVLLQPGHTDQTVTLPQDSGGALMYRYEVHRIDAAGDTIVQSGQGSDRLLIVRTSS